MNEVLNVASQVGKKELTPTLSPSFNDFTEDNSFCLVLEREGEALGMAAARRDNVGTEGAASFTRRMLDRQYRGDNSAVMDFEYNPPPIARSMEGSLAYVGELEFEAKTRGRRQVVRDFMSLLFLSIADRWDPDWIYAFMMERHIMLGMHTVYGFTGAYPLPHQWKDVPDGRYNNEYLVTLPRRDLEFTMTHFHREVVFGNGRRAGD